MTQLDVTVSLGKTVRQFRKQIGLSQEKLAERANLHRTYLAGVESGARNPSLVSLHKLAQALGMPLATLFSASPPIPSSTARPRTSLPLDACPDMLLFEPEEKAARPILRVFHRANLLNRVILARNAVDATDYAFGSGRCSGQPAWRVPGLLLIDFHSGGKAARDLVNRLKSEKLTARIPVIALVPSKGRSRAAQAQRLGVQGQLATPFEFADLHRILVKLGFYPAFVR